MKKLGTIKKRETDNDVWIVLEAITSIHLTTQQRPGEVTKRKSLPKPELDPLSEGKLLFETRTEKSPLPDLGRKMAWS